MEQGIESLFRVYMYGSHNHEGRHVQSKNLKKILKKKNSLMISNFGMEQQGLKVYKPYIKNEPRHEKINILISDLV